MEHFFTYEGSLSGASIGVSDRLRDLLTLCAKYPLCQPRQLISPQTL